MSEPPRPSPDPCLRRLAELGIATVTHDHAAVFTVAGSAGVKAALPGAHSKNLFLKDKKGRLFLVSARDTTGIDLKHLHKSLGASGRLSFGSAEQLLAVLGVEPGSVTPFAVMNDLSGQVTAILDAALMEEELLNFHPLVNTKTTAIARDDLVRFMTESGHPPRIIPLSSRAVSDCTADDPGPS